MRYAGAALILAAVLAVAAACSVGSSDDPSSRVTPSDERSTEVTGPSGEPTTPTEGLFRDMMLSNWDMEQQAGWRILHATPTSGFIKEMPARVVERADDDRIVKVIERYAVYDSISDWQQHHILMTQQPLPLADPPPAGASRLEAIDRFEVLITEHDDAIEARFETGHFAGDDPIIAIVELDDLTLLEVFLTALL